jgi:hypothetical protein
MLAHYHPVAFKTACSTFPGAINFLRHLWPAIPAYVLLCDEMMFMPKLLGTFDTSNWVAYE